MRRVERQIKAFLAVLECLLGVFAFGGVEKGTEQIGLAFQFDPLGTEDAVVDLAVAGPELHLLADRFAARAQGLDQPFAFLRVDPQAQFHGGHADHLERRPAEQAFEILVGLADQAVFLAGQQHHVGAQVKEGGEAFLRTAQGLFALTLLGHFADHADHPWLAVLVRQQAAIDFQPVQATVRPADTVVHGPFLPRVAGPGSRCRWAAVDADRNRTVPGFHETS